MKSKAIDQFKLNGMMKQKKTLTRLPFDFILKSPNSIK